MGDLKETRVITSDLELNDVARALMMHTGLLELEESVGSPARFFHLEPEKDDVGSIAVGEPHFFPSGSEWYARVFEDVNGSFRIERYQDFPSLNDLDNFDPLKYDWQ